MNCKICKLDQLELIKCSKCTLETCKPCIINWYKNSNQKCPQCREYRTFNIKIKEYTYEIMSFTSLSELSELSELSDEEIILEDEA